MPTRGNHISGTPRKFELVVDALNEYSCDGYQLVMIISVLGKS